MMYTSLKIGKSCSLISFVLHTELKIDESHLAVEVCMQESDKYDILWNINQMIEEAKDTTNQIQTLSGKNIEPETAVLVLEDLRRWFITEYCSDMIENCTKIVELQHALAKKDDEIKGLKGDVEKSRMEWEREKEKIGAEMEAMKRKDEWANRVSYENIVDQIASLEDASKRDDARRVFEPLLKRNQVTQLRNDIKRRVKEMNSESSGTNITIGQAEVKVQSPGNNIAHTIINNKE